MFAIRRAIGIGTAHGEAQALARRRDERIALRIEIAILAELRLNLPVTAGFARRKVERAIGFARKRSSDKPQVFAGLRGRSVARFAGILDAIAAFRLGRSTHSAHARRPSGPADSARAAFATHTRRAALASCGFTACTGRTIPRRRRVRRVRTFGASHQSDRYAKQGRCE